MRPINTSARTLLEHELKRRGKSDAISLAKESGVSVPSVHRIIRERGDAIVRVGTTRNTRYALRRPLRGQLAPIPVYAVDAAGRGRQLSAIELIEPQGSTLDVGAIGWPVPAGCHAWWDGLPYPLQDMRPQGFLGRSLARQIAQDFNVSENPEEWSDDDVVYVLSVRGHDNPGNLIIGEKAYRAYLSTLTQPPEIIPEHLIQDRYAELAEIAIQYGGAGSSAAGEFPKFTATRALPGATTPHVIVKFSGADGSPAVRRWSDLLICEHLALEVLGSAGHVDASRSRIIMAQGRTFLEVERFDRVGEFGRLATGSLYGLDAAFVGMGNGSWVEAASRLAQIGLVPGSLIEKIRLLWWFGKLIANTDMHFGNLSFFLGNELGLTPAYDMLPMSYPPLPGGEVPVRRFEVVLPMPEEQDAWNQAFDMARKFWELVADDGRITEDFRGICRANLQQLRLIGARLGLVV
ncbi:type II toxin-antitoxin system HipA family toxin YjjJ [Methylobacillus arboreus]|uniref:type II toxin-antitoxin system HipA family toxin YjjJ n=1 Tax=Methylobacillus arboreus TaxID=755170 RepID=UPI001E6199F7|nr:type II toxin-antitoxin system HipA family toxin YjjJ [Methylobacillus arboreus]MCB5189986.1 type II toxin-antitoxin system HipA family toxin YjjJ [Methylobacillus arboreus]